MYFATIKDIVLIVITQDSWEAKIRRRSGGEMGMQ